MEEFVRDLFSLLAAGFKYPESEETILKIKTISGVLAEACRDEELKILLKDLEKNELGLRALQYEYTALFILRYPESPCHPYESVYREPDGRTMGESTIDVLETYLKNGFAVEGKELPDHISLELEFIAKTSYKRAKEFVERHLSTWYEKFCKCVEEKDGSGFYALLARILHRAIELYFR